MNIDPHVSIIIPARNEEAVIGPCLDSLIHLDFPRECFEVILVDNGSSDRTLEVARARSESLHLTILQKSGVRISALRNLGASHSRGRVLAFLDADCLAPSNWLTRGTHVISQPGVGVAGAHYRIPEDSSWVAQAWYGDEVAEKQGPIPWVPGGDLMMARAIFDEVGGFDATIQTNEDCELCDRVREAGYQVIGDPLIAVTHLGTPQTLGGFYRKVVWHATDAVRVFRNKLPRITNVRPLLFGLYTLLCLVGVAAGLGRIVLRQTWAVLAISAVLLVLPSLLLSARLCARRKKWAQLLPLTVLHVAYGLARGRALLGAGTR